MEFECLSASYDVGIAKKYGINCAILLNKLIYLSKYTAREDGYCWRTSKELEDELGLTRFQQDKAIKKLEEEGIIETKNTYISGTQVKCKHFKLIVKSEIKETYISDLRETYKSDLRESSKSIIINKHNNNNIIINNNINNMSSKTKEIIDYLNQPDTEEPVRSFKTTSKNTKSLISARLKEGFTVDDFKDVIFFKYNQWVIKPFKFSNGVMSDTYYRPDTLFNSKNFENYLQEYKESLK